MRNAASAKRALLSIALCAGLPGCTTFGTNVSGSFRCEAPDGICAPSTVIDDRALKEIARGDRDGFASPAGLYKVDDGIVPGQVAKDEGPAMPTEGFRLTVVFPAYTDIGGIEHERSVASVEAHLPGRNAGSVELARRPRGAGSPGLLAAAQGAPFLEEVIAKTPAQSDVVGEIAGPEAKSAVDRVKAEAAARMGRRATRQADPFPAQE